MAKRKAAGGTRKAARKSSRAGSRTSGRKTAKSAKTARRKATRAGAKAARRPARPAAKAKAARKVSRAAKPKVVAIKRAAPKPKVVAIKRAAAKSGKPPKKKAAGRAPANAPRSAPPARTREAVKASPVRKAPSLNRERRTIPDEEEEMVPSPPSTLDLDRSASAVRSGRRGMQQKFADHTETSPAMTAGDVDADWESAYSVGDEAPGGDNPTPDQDIVDDIGKAVGVEYQDNEELKGEEKITKRDAHRWELDPASSEDWDDRD
jgi:hypothetical protein